MFDMENKDLKINYFSPLILLIASILAQNKIFFIISFGAKEKGQNNNELVIQKTINAVSAHGRGKVVISVGNFASRVIFLKSNIELQLDLVAGL